MASKESSGGWSKQWDPSSQSFYYYDSATKQTSWQQPVGFVESVATTSVECDASVKIQSLYRGRRARKRVQQSQWIEQFDPTSKHNYYYNTVKGTSQWEKPRDFSRLDASSSKDKSSRNTGDRLGSEGEDQMKNAVKIQCAFRSMQARQRVRDLKGVATDANSMAVNPEQDQLTDAANAASSCEWTQHFDPRSNKFYYANALTNQIAWERPPDFTSNKDASQAKSTNAEMSSATTIQCAFRKHQAARRAQQKRDELNQLRETGAIEDIKLTDLQKALNEIQLEISQRCLSPNETVRFVEANLLLHEWSAHFRELQDKSIALCQSFDEYVQREQWASEQDNESVETVLELHQRFVRLQQECLALRSRILDSNKVFVLIDVERVNAARQEFGKWKDSEILGIKDVKLQKLVQLDSLHQLFAMAEMALRRIMGLTHFTNGVLPPEAMSLLLQTMNELGPGPKSADKFRENHELVCEALESVERLNEQMVEKTQMVAAYRESQRSHQEMQLMQLEEKRTRRLMRASLREVARQEQHALYIEMCRSSWQKGLTRRQEDYRARVAQDTQRLEAVMKKRETMLQAAEMHREVRRQIKFSLWEAAREGLGVDELRAMVQAELQKARQMGYEFSVRTSRSEYGETLLQIACWWGHAHLVGFFLEEGGDLFAVDSLCNRFTLLHDAARRGHSDVIKLLLQKGLPHDIQDASGDTPLHWAARRNFYDAVHTLLGAHHHDNKDIDQVLKMVRTRNKRGRTAVQLTKSESIRRLIQAFDEGRLPLFASRRPTIPAASDKPRAETPPTPTYCGPKLSSQQLHRTRTAAGSLLNHSKDPMGPPFDKPLLTARSMKGF